MTLIGALIATVSMVGCASTSLNVGEVLGTGEDEEPPAASQPRGIEAKEGFEEALQIASNSPVSPEDARVGKRAAKKCQDSIGSLLATYDRSNKRIYDPEKETLPTSKGALTLNVIKSECKKMYDAFKTADLRTAPAAKAADPALEQDILTAAQKHAKSEGWKEDFQRVILTSRDWRIERHPASGVITGRVRAASAGARWPDGHCTYQASTFRQQHDGKDFTGALSLVSVGEQVRVNCATLSGGP